MRDIPVGNGSLLVCFDADYQIRDIYFPHVGQENHTDGHPFRFGVWVDGSFSWISDAAWSRELRYVKESLVTEVTLENGDLELCLESSDTVASHDNIFLRRVRVFNNASEKRSIRVFLHQDFRLYENKVGDTAHFDPATSGLIHYQKQRYFLMATEPAFDAFATGRKDFHGQEGTWRDAEDGELHGGATTEGSVDSTIGVHFEIEGRGSAEFFYWIAAGESYDEVARLDRLVHNRGPAAYLDYTENYWRVWVNKDDADYSPLPDHIADLVIRSLLIIHTQIDGDGAILAANDWDVTARATDHYSYLWPRDGAFVAHALDMAGFGHLTRKFFSLCGEIVHPDGYFLQKYNADGSVASGWHPAWDPNTRTPMLPIQEDETGLVLWALWEHYSIHRDIEFAHRLYGRMVKPCADFMSAFIDPDLGLPKPSWNLWEDRRGIHTFTCAAVIAGLRAAANFAELFAEPEIGRGYRAAANSIKDAMRKHLYSRDHGRFLRSLEVAGGGLRPDATVDASLFAVFALGCLPPDDEMVISTMSAIENKLAAGGGVARFENDGYMREGHDMPGNAWFICTLWLADHYIALATSRKDLRRAGEILDWASGHALPSGTLSEQIDPVTGRQLSVSPLTWSHSTFVATALRYRDKLRELA